MVKAKSLDLGKEKSKVIYYVGKHLVIVFFRIFLIIDWGSASLKLCVWNAASPLEPKLFSSLTVGEQPSCPNNES